MSAKHAAPGPMLTVEEVANEFRVCTRSVRRWIAEGDLAIHKFGRAIRVARGDLDAFKRANRSAS